MGKTHAGWERVTYYRPVLRRGRRVIKRSRMIYKFAVFAKRHAARRLHA